MSENPTAIHVQTGDAVWAERIDAWLAQHGFAVERFSDAYAACARLVQSPAKVAALVLVGCDWLAPEAHALVERVRETWPACAIVAYARDSSLLPASCPAPRPDRPQDTRLIAAERDLAGLLAGAPVRRVESGATVLSSTGERLRPAPDDARPTLPRPDAPRSEPQRPQGVAGVLSGREIALLLGEAGQ